MTLVNTTLSYASGLIGDYSIYFACMLYDFADLYIFTPEGFNMKHVYVCGCQNTSSRSDPCIEME